MVPPGSLKNTKNTKNTVPIEVVFLVFYRVEETKVLSNHMGTRVRPPKQFDLAVYRNN